MRLTRRGVVLLAVAAGCYAIGELAGYPFFRVIAGIALGVVLIALATTRFRPKVVVGRTVRPDRVERGKPALASLVVRNTGARRHGGFAAGDGIGGETHRLRVRPLAPGAEAMYRLCGVPLAKAVRARRRRRRRRSGVDGVLGAWAERCRRSGGCPLRRTDPGAGRQTAKMLDVTLWSGVPVGDGSVRRAWQEVRELRRGPAGRPLSTRVRAALEPRTLLPPADAWRRTDHPMQ